MQCQYSVASDVVCTCSVSLIKYDIYSAVNQTSMKAVSGMSSRKDKMIWCWTVYRVKNVEKMKILMPYEQLKSSKRF